MSAPGIDKMDPSPPPIGFMEPGAMPMPPVVKSPPPPTYTEATVQLNCPISEEELKECILKYYDSDCCFSKDSINNLTIRDITPMHAFRYVLDTFWETRVVKSEKEPYKNQVIDGPQNGPVPDKWSVFVPAASGAQFVDRAKVSMEMPHSSTVMSCNNCAASGYEACTWCNGLGFKNCTWCNGTGRKERFIDHTFESCTSCGGAGRSTCTSCQLGRVQCNTCRGHRSLRCWDSLEVKWKTVTLVHETSCGELKPKHLKKAKVNAKEVLDQRESDPRDPQPLNCSMDPSLCETAVRMIQAQLGKQDQDNRVIKFRQKIGIIPVVKSVYDYGGKKEGNFYVFGHARLVYFPGGYPGGGCCGGCCSVM